MAKLVAVVADAEFGPRPALAVEALRHAAARDEHRIAIELRAGAQVLTPIENAELADADGVLLVGELAVDEARFAGLPRAHARLDEVLADPAACLARVTEAPRRPIATPPARPQRIVAVTSCPTGIAHTFMAAEGLTQAGARLGHDVRIETQGSVGIGTRLTPAEIHDADLVIIAADQAVDRARFEGKRVFVAATRPAIDDGVALVLRALAEAHPQGAPPAAPDAGRATGPTGPYRHLMTGVSFMLPFVVAGGLLIALAFALGGAHAGDASRNGTLAHDLFMVGAAGAFTLIVPVLAGYIAFSIADRPGIAPGMVGGLIATQMEAGFLGGLVAGFLAGYVVLFLTRLIVLPATLQGLKPVLILPLLGTLVTGLAMLMAGGPIAVLLAALTAWLDRMQGGSAILLGLLLGGMMAIDIGGPINKAAYVFAVGLIATGATTPMAAVMVGGMTPPLGLALATVLFGGRFTQEERQAAGAASVLGLSFVTEGAIPFAARDPLRVLPATVCGSAVAGAISMASGVGLLVPHGGIFVLPIPHAVTHLGACVIALLAGTVVTTVALFVLKRPVAAASARPA